MRFRVPAAFAAALFVTVAIALPATAATITVDSTDDAVDIAPGDGQCKTAANVCTLRAAIMEANAAPSADTIVLPAGNYFMSLTAIEDGGISGDYDITTTAVISGAGRNATFIYGLRYTANDNRVFDVRPGASLDLRGLTIANGHATGAEGGYGGGILNQGALALSDVEINGSAADVYGGGLYNLAGVVSGSSVSVTVNTAQLSGGGIGQSSGTISLTRSYLFNSQAVSGTGGALYAFTGQINLTRVDIALNAAPDCGGIDTSHGTFDILTGTVRQNTGVTGGICLGLGFLRPNVVATLHAVNVLTNTGRGIHNNGALRLIDSQVASNTANSGGGILNTGDLTLDRARVSRNRATASFGGGIYNEGALTLTQSSVTTNTAAVSGGGFYSYLGAVVLSSTLVSGNRAASAGGMVVSSARASIAQSSFITNSASNASGGGLGLYSSSVTLTAGSLISNNTAAVHGGGIDISGGSLVLFDTNMEANQAGQSGGGLYGFADRIDGQNLAVLRNRAVAGTGGGVSASGLTLLADSRVSQNRSGGSGGGVYSGGSLSVTNTTLDGNNAAGMGGGLASSGEGGVLTNLSFSQNTAASGGAIAHLGGALEIAGGSVQTNSATDGGGIYAADTMTVARLTVRANSASGKGGGAYVAFSSRSLITSTWIVSNSAGAGGGGIRTAGNTGIISSVIELNTSPGAGGGILADYYADGLSRVEIERATLKANTAGAGGGAYIASLARVASSSLTGNLSNGHGGGLYAANVVAGRELALENSTLGANVAVTHGGGIYVGGSLLSPAIVNSTIVGNYANNSLTGPGQGGGIFNSLGAGFAGYVVYISNTIVAGNMFLTESTPGFVDFNPNDCGGNVYTHYALIGTLSGCSHFGPTSRVNVGAGLGPLADNGGPTRTYKPGLSSPAVDGGNPAGCRGADGALLLFDQRGGARPLSGRCDIGAVETLARTFLPRVVRP